MSPKTGLCALLVACAAPADGASSADDALIGGAVQSPTALPGTVYLDTGCTAAKVGPALLLTAGHCVLDAATLDPRWKPGDTIKIGRPPSEALREHKVAATHVHPDWKKACSRTFCASSAVTVRLDAPDVAVLELATDLDGVPVAPVDLTPLDVGDAVTIVGFGCTDGVLQTDDTAGRALKASETKILDASAALHEGSALRESDLPIASGIYAMTAGPGLAGAAAGLCPGDSGGPLYRRRATELTVVGVNANYTFRPDKEDARGLPVTNWHTRLDERSRQKVGAWLRMLGVTVR